MDVDTFRDAPKIPLHIVLDNIRSLMNIGSVFRTADAFRVEHIYLCGITAQPPHRDIQKTALGATDSVSWSHHPSIQQLLNDLQARDIQLIGVEQTTNSKPLQEFTETLDKPLALIFGNEVQGVQEAVLERCDQCLEIPQFGSKHSLNISVSAGIVIWHFFQILQARL
jgi:tRNA G18 (ribose-2'-O)-methylase SpoU